MPAEPTELPARRVYRDLSALPADRQLDAQVHVLVMGGDLCGCGNPLCDLRGDGDYGLVPPYSTDIAAAWQVEKQLRTDGWSFALWHTPPQSSVLNAVTAAFVRGVHPPEMYGEAARRNVYGIGETDRDNPAEAICRGALAVKRQEREARDG